MRFLLKSVATLSCLLLAAVWLAQFANGQPQSTMVTPAKTNPTEAGDQGWHLDAAPYLWLPGVFGTVGVVGHDSSVHVTPGELLSNFSFGLAGAVEARHARILIPIDFMWVKLSDDKGIPITDNVKSVHVRLNEELFAPKIGYRIVNRSRFKADVLVGVRYWHLGTTLTLQPTQTKNGFYGAANWVDGVEGARFQASLTPKLLISVVGDAGGGGAKLDYQVLGLLGYKVKKVTIQAGWRYLVIHKAPGEHAFAELSFSGVIVGAVIPLK